jgi:hypothetical protein
MNFVYDPAIGLNTGAAFCTIIALGLGMSILLLDVSTKGLKRRLLIIASSVLAVVFFCGALFFGLQADAVANANRANLIHAVKDTYGVTLSEQGAADMLKYTARADYGETYGTTKVRTSSGLQEVTLYDFKQGGWELGVTTEVAGSVIELPRV